MIPLNYENPIKNYIRYLWGKVSSEMVGTDWNMWCRVANPTDSDLERAIFLLSIIRHVLCLLQEEENENVSNQAVGV